MNQGELVVISGFSGSGKGTLVGRLMEKYDRYALSVSVTTRDPRPGEQEGVSYFFRTQDEFDRMVADNAFLEHASYVDHSYGTPKFYVEEQQKKGRDVILEIEIQGALQVKKENPEAILIFLTPPSAEELERRLIGRKTETAEVIRSRLRRAVEESEGMDQYDYLVINDDLDACADEVHAIIQSHHCRIARQGDFIQKIRKELKEREETES